MLIAAVSKKYDITIDTLRYYERVGLIPRVRRASGGARDYAEGDLGWVEFVKCMRGAGVEIAALREYLRLHLEGDATIGARKQILIDQRAKIAAKIADGQALLDKLDNKIKTYERSLLPFENSLSER
ncbi:MAG: MerR family transcriptional regulator [Deltaproteobacteria bacterium]|nr:MerR family transcriptional regulator [Deltaproteobacteria bacterium]